MKFKLGDWAGALEDYNRAIFLNQNNTEAYNNRGVLKFNMGEQAGVLEDYNKAISLKPDYINAYINRALFYKKVAESEVSPLKKADLIAKAEADEKKAESLKKEEKK